MGNYHDIRRRHQGDDDDSQRFVIHNGETITALCVRKDLNPKITANPAEVWVGAVEKVAEWGAKLANHAGEIPVYIADGAGSDYRQQGVYNVLPRQHTAEEIREAHKHVPHKISRIVYLDGSRRI